MLFLFFLLFLLLPLTLGVLGSTALFVRSGKLKPIMTHHVFYWYVRIAPTKGEGNSFPSLSIFGKPLSF